MRFIFAALVAFAFSTISASSYAASPSLNGSWSGGGIVTPVDGAKERARCRLTFEETSSTTYSVIAKCSTPTLGVVTQNAMVTKVGKNRYHGNFHNSEYNVNGSILVHVKGRRQSMTLKSDRGIGRFNLAKRR